MTQTPWAATMRPPIPTMTWLMARMFWGSLLSPTTPVGTASPLAAPEDKSRLLAGGGVE